MCITSAHNGLILMHGSSDTFVWGVGSKYCVQHGILGNVS